MQHRGRSPPDFILAEVDLTATCLATMAQNSPFKIRAFCYIANRIERGAVRVINGDCKYKLLDSAL